MYEPYSLLRGSWSVARRVPSAYEGAECWQTFQIKEGGKLGPQLYLDRDKCQEACDRLNASCASRTT